MISVDEYNKRVYENKQIYLNQVASGSFDFTKFHGVDALAGEVTLIRLLKKVHDIYTAVNLNMLPYLTEHIGADAVKLVNNEFYDVELKTCFVDITPNSAFKTAKNTIYTTKDVSKWGDKVERSKVALLTSAFKASFTIKNNLHTKNRDTYLLLIDGNNSNVIDCFMLEGQKVVEFLETSRDIKLGSFIKYGHSISHNLNNYIGWQKWVDSILPTLPTKQVLNKKAVAKI